MPPERIGDSNWWKLPEGEVLTGIDGQIEGPAIVRLEEYVGTRQASVQIWPGSRRIFLKTKNLARYTTKISQNP